MLLTQVFKTAEGADKRARFETAHSGRHTFRAVRCIRGEPDAETFDRDRFIREEYTWRLARTPRTISL
jgi:hypothetical protein